MFEAIKDILDFHLVADDMISLDARFVEDFGFDDIDMTQFIVDVEDTFDVTISQEILEHLETLGDLMKFLEKNAPPKASYQFKIEL